MILFDNQKLPFAGIPNARELGGYVMQDGGRIKRGKLLRSGTLTKATDDDLRLLKEVYNVQHVFDYRSPQEQQYMPDRTFEGADFISLPCIDLENDLFSGTLIKDHFGKSDFNDFVVEYSFTEEGKDVSREMYPSFVKSEFTQLQYGTFLNFATKDEKGAILWHCSQGKDRTGLGAAFILSVLGASRELIIEDFNLSNYFYRDLVKELSDRVIQKGGGQKELDVVKAFVGVNTDFFIQSLDLIDEKFGSMSDYINDQLCITSLEIECIKHRFLEYE